MESGRGIFIDFDGTLCDSISLLEDAYLRFLDHFGVIGTATEFRSLIGPTVPEIVVTLKKIHCLEASVGELTQEFEHQIAAIYDRVPPMPGAVPFVQMVFTSGWKVVVVTSNSERVTKAWLEEKQLTGFIQGVFGRESVKNGKPAPDLYLKALEASGCTVSRSIAIEDSPRGAEAAIAAGLKTYVLTNEPNGSPKRAKWVKSFSEVLSEL